MDSDQQLWRAIRDDDDEQAFSTLFYRYSSRIYSKAYGYIRDRDACKKIVQDIFLSLWSNRKTLEIDSFIAYLTSASRYRVYKFIGQVKASRLDYKDQLEDEADHSTINEGYQHLVSVDLERELGQHLQELPERCREIFLLSRFQQLSNDEIAHKLGISKRTVENQITAALKYLRMSLKNSGVLLIIFEGLRNL